MNARLLRMWLRLSAAMGMAAWLVLAVASWASGPELDTYQVMFLLAPLVVVPLALALLVKLEANVGRSPVFLVACLAQPPAAWMVATSFAFAAGVWAGLLTLPWAGVCILVALAAARAFQVSQPRTAGALCARLGMLYLSVGAGALLLSRLGVSPLGFEEPIVFLTAVHFHYTGFAAPVSAAALGEAATLLNPHRDIFRLASLGLVTATPLLAAGWMLDSAAWKLACVLALVASLAVLAGLTLRVALPSGRLLPRALLAMSAGSVLFGMVMAGLYAVGEFAGHSLVGLHDMARLHGTANGFGFTLCGLLGWNLRLTGDPKPKEEIA